MRLVPTIPTFTVINAIACYAVQGPLSVLEVVKYPELQALLYGNTCYQRALPTHNRVRNTIPKPRPHREDRRFGRIAFILPWSSCQFEFLIRPVGEPFLRISRVLIAKSECSFTGKLPPSIRLNRRLFDARFSKDSRVSISIRCEFTHHRPRLWLSHSHALSVTIRSSPRISAP